MNSTASELREWAARCEEQAATASTENERRSLLAKADGLRSLAESEDWLAGRAPNIAPCAVIKSQAAE